MTTQNIVVESGEPTARWGTTLLVIFGPTLVMLLIAGFLTEILHYASTGLAFANAYVFATIGMQLLFLALVAWLLQKEGSGLLHLINIVPSQLPKQLGIGLIVLLICLVISLLSTSFGAQPGSAVILSGFPYFFALVIGSAVAGMSVEIIWRGYGLTRLKVLTKSTVWAVVISTIGSALWHLNPALIAVNVIVGLLFSLVYILQRSLVPVIFAHWTRDIIGYLFQLLPFSKF